MKKWMTAAAVFLGAAICCAGASLSASAEVTVDDDGVMHLYGNFTKEEIKQWWRGYFTDSDSPYPYMYYHDESIKKIVAEEGSVFPQDSSNLFRGLAGLLSADLTNADTSNVTDMSGMFSFCRWLQSLDLSSFDTSKVTDMSEMFCESEELESVDLSSFDTSKVTDMSEMFCGCTCLHTLDVSNLDTSKVTDMSYMFGSCYMEALDVSNFNTSNVTDMDGMFCDCKSLKTLDLSNYDTSKVTHMSEMFSSCESLESLDLSSFDTSNVVGMFDMFRYCKALESLDLIKFDTSNVINMSGMFWDCESLKTLDLSSFDTSNVKWIYSMFRRCTNLTTIYVSELWNTLNFRSEYDYMDYPFRDCPNLVGGNGTECDGIHNIIVDYAQIDGKDDKPGYFTYRANGCRVNTRSLTLDGSIKVNFFVFLNAKAEKIVLSGPNGDVVYSGKKLKAAIKGDSADNYYKFTYRVNPTQGHDQITLKILDVNDIPMNFTYNVSSHEIKSAGTSLSYSVFNYIRSLKSFMSSEKLTALVNALENYCKAAENNFGVRTYDNLDIAQADFTAYKPVKTGSETAKLALVTNSETAIRIAYEGTGAVTYGGKTLTKTDGYYFIRNIPAHQLGIGKTLKIGDTTFENMSALSYGYYVMKDSNNANLKTLVNALYAYAKAAEAYKAAQ